MLVTAVDQSHGEAFHVAGTNTVILPGVPGISAPGLVKQAEAAGTICTVTAEGPPGALQPIEPVVVPVVIING